MSKLGDDALAQLFLSARSVHSFTDQPVDDELIRALYDLLKWGPTAFNCQPARYVFVRSAQGKQRLAPALLGNNLEKTLKAPVTVIVAIDSRFHEHLPVVFHAGKEAKALFEERPAMLEPTAMRNGCLQAAYLMLAARALGLAAGPMSGFDAGKLDAEFFPDGGWRSNILVNLGYWDGAIPGPRGTRLPFEDVARLA